MKVLEHEEIYPRGSRTMADVMAHLPHFLENGYHNTRQPSALNDRLLNAFAADYVHTLTRSDRGSTLNAVRARTCAVP